MINSSLVTSKTTLPTVEGSVFKRLVVALMIGLQIVPIGLLQSYAQTAPAPIVVAPGTGQRPVVTVSGNGVPVVQIAPPTAGGVSVNTFNQFNVGANGVVLNNSGANNQSQLGGWVAGNPMLGNNHARTILNQVTGSTGSALNGYIEASGNKANVVIANPNGITCDGCGFINIPNATLTTGQVQLGTNSAGQGGSITGVNVTQGVVIVNGKGMDASGVNQLDILTRSAQINANVWAGNNNPATNGGNNASNINVILGVNQIATDGNGAASGNPTITSSNAANATAAAPTVALDVSNLGGMYAGAIRLIGTEAGLGVNSAGAIQATSSNLQLSNNGTVSFSSTANTQAKTDLTLSATQGNLSNAGSIVAGGNVQLQTNGANSTITNSGSVYAQGNTALTANATSGTVNNTGFIGAQGNTSVNTAQFTQSSAGTLAAGVATDGKLGTSGTVAINSTIANTGTVPAPTQGIQNAGQIVAGKDVVLSSVAAISNQTGGMVSANETVTIATTATSTADGANSITNSGTVTANTAVTLNAANGAAAINNTSGNIQSAALTLTSNELNNTGGQLIQTGTGNLTLTAANGINNTNGLISSNATNLTLASNGAASSAINNTNGRIEAAGTGALTISTTGVLTNTGANAAIVSNNTANLSTGAGISNTAGATVQAQTLVIATPTLNNNGGTLIQTGTANQSITPTGELSNVEGVIASNAANLSISAQNINNAGGTVQHAGTGNLTVTATNELNNSATANAAGAIVGNNTVTVNAATINNTGLNVANPSLITATKALTITTTSNAGDTATATSLNNTQGLIAAGTELNLNAANTVNNAGGTIQAASLTLQAGNLNNTALATGTGTGASAQAAQLIQTGAAGTASITTTGTLNNTGGVIASNAGLTLNSQNLTNTAVGTGINATGGAIQSAGAASIKVAQTLGNTQGNIVTGKDILIESFTFNNTQGVIQATTGLSVQTSTLDNTQGAIVAQGAGAVSPTNPASMNVTGALTNLDGTIAFAANSATITANSLDNARGTIQLNAPAATVAAPVGDLTLAIANATNNSAGSITSTGNVVLTTGTLTNTAQIVSTNITAANPTGFTQGSIQALGNLTVTSTQADTATNPSINNTQGTLNAGQATTVTSAGALTNTSGTIQAGTALNVTTSGALTNGTLASSPNSPANLAGLITAQQVAINTNGGALNNSQGAIVAYVQTPLAAPAGATNATPASTPNAATLRIDSGALTNDAGLIQSTGNSSTTTPAAAALSINTGNNALTNANSGSSNGIISNGATLINTGSASVNNTGYIASNGALTITAAALNNTAATRAANQSIINAADLTVNAGAVNNQNGSIQANNATFNLGTDTNPGTLDNQGTSLIAARNALTINAAIISNQGTQTATVAANDPSIAYGIEGKTVTLNDISTAAGTATASAGTVNNQGGAIRAANDLTVNAATLNNQAGLVSSSNTATITATSINNQTLNGQAGLLTAGNLLTVTTTHLDNTGGKIIGVKDAVITINNNYVHGASDTLKAGNNLTLNTQNLTNNGKLLAGNTLEVNATNITNNAAGEFNATNTHLNASPTGSGNITNYGLIDGYNTVLKAGGNIDNLGGRIYGDNIAIQANTLTNTVGNSTANAGVAGVIAARQNLDIGVQTLNNQSNALIYSAGTINIGGSIDAATQRALGSAIAVTNSASTIDAGTTLKIAAATIKNQNPAFSYSLIDGSPVQKRQYLDATNHAYTDAQFAWISGSALAPKSTNGALLKTSPYADVKYKAFYEGPQAYIEAADSYDYNCDCTVRSPVQYAYDQNSPIWANFGITPPTGSNPGDRPQRTLGTDAAGEFVWIYPTAAELAAWDAAAAPWVALQAKLNTFRSEVNASLLTFSTYRDITETPQIPQVNLGTPSLITSGTHMTLEANSISNVNSKIVAGGTLYAPSASVTNTETPIQVSVNEAGTTFVRTYFPQTGYCNLPFGATLNCVRAHWAWVGSAYAGSTPSTLNISSAVQLQNSLYTPNGTQAAVQGVISPVSAATGMLAQSTGAAILGKTDGKTLAVQGAFTRLARTPTPAIGTITQVNPPAGSTTLAIRTVQPNTTAPNNALFKVNTNPGQHALIETDPRFANYKTWINSDVLIAALGQQPNNVLQRLGDGFYEQKLIQEQIIAVTGQRFTGDYTSNETQYKALLLNGAEFANNNQGLNLSLGVALTEAQMRNLTTDIVWLVEQTIQLPNGQTAQALVPQVYLRVKPGDLKGDGSLISGRDINLNLSGDLNNSGTLAGRNSTFISAENINNSAKDPNSRDAANAPNNTALGGRITGNVISLTAKQDINNLGGQILGTQSAGQDASQDTSIIQLKAGRDINIATTTQSTSGDTRNNAGIGTLNTRSTIDQVGTIQAGNVAMFAGRDLTIAGASVSATSGNLILSADRNVKLATVQTAEQTNINFGSNRAGGNTLNQGSTTQVGSQLGASGQVYISAGRQAVVATDTDPAKERSTGNVSSTGASIAAGSLVTINATGNIELLAAKNTANFAQETSSYSKGFLSKSSSNSKTATQTSESAGTTISAGAINMNAGIGAPRDLSGATGNITAQGANLVADGDISIRAANNVTLTTAANTEDSQNSSQVKKSGFTAMQGGINVGYSASKTNTTGNSSEVTNTGTLVGSLEGNVTIVAGNQYTQTGSAVVTPVGDITIQAKKVDINEARDTYSGQSTQSSKQTGITVGLSGGIISSATAAYNATAAATSGGGYRNQTLNTLTAYAKGSDAVEQGKVGMNAMQKDGGSMAQGAAAAGVKLTVSLGTSKSSSASSTTSNTASGSTVKSGGSVSITATDSDITAQGSTINAAQNTTLDAKQNINLLASADLESNRSSNKSSSTSVGVSLGAGGLTLDVAASRGKGAANSDSATYNNTQIGAGNTLTIKSGGDTNIKGATATGTQVNATIGGNLNIESLQDTATSAAQQKTTGVALSIPITGAGSASASVSQSKQSSNSTYQSVNQQSGIQAGSADGKTGGFNINVAGNTDLKGAVIASTAAPTSNILSTQSLTTSELQNAMTASASSSGINLSTSMASGKYEAAKGAIGNAMNRGSAKDSDAGTTTSAIAAGQITVGAAGSTSNPLTTTDTSKAPLVDSNGKTVSTNTANASTSTPVRQANVQALQTQASKQQTDNNLLVTTMSAFTDEAFKKSFITQAKMYKKVTSTDADGKPIISWAEMSDAEKAAIPKGAKVANNGIFTGEANAPQAAQSLAQQNNNADYLVHFPQANNAVAELLIAGYQKFLEGGTMGLTNATQQNVQLWQQTGGNITLDGHSRGGMTTGNALNYLDSTGVKGTNTQVNLFGSAYNAQDAANTVNSLTNGTGQVTQSTHNNDPVGTVLGGNPGTGGNIPEGSNVLKEWLKMLGGESTVHNCYGEPNRPGCIPYITPPINIVPVRPTSLPTSNSGDKK